MLDWIHHKFLKLNGLLKVRSYVTKNSRTVFRTTHKLVFSCTVEIRASAGFRHNFSVQVEEIDVYTV